MKLHILVIRDIVANVYGQPNFVASIGGAIRGFGDQINNPQKPDVISQHPEHFEMYKLGMYDDETAKFDLLPQPEQVATGANLTTTKN